MFFARQHHRAVAKLTTIPEEQSEHFLSSSADAGNKSCSNNDNKTLSRTATKKSLSSVGTIELSLQDDHHWVNVARANHHHGGGLVPLQRTVHLDELAQAHAHVMARQRSVFHSVNSVNALRNKLCSIHVGENILRGQSILTMHMDIINSSSSSSSMTSFLRNNILCDTFDQMGMGTALGQDGLVYLVQVFRSTKE